MELTALVDRLSSPQAYPYPVERVEVRHTHISVVFLAGDFVYKIKKPVDLGFLDFTTLAKRRHFCDEEVRLNRRLAADVYLGVVPIIQNERGISLEGSGDALEWAVKMRRLDEKATLQQRLVKGEVAPQMVVDLAGRIARFHESAEKGEAIAAFGRFDVVARNARENFEQAGPQIGVTVSQAVFDRLRQLTEEHLEKLSPLIEERARQGVPRDTHGDLHLDHVYLFPDRPAPANLTIIDCIEFNERFRFADPVADMAFLYMDLLFHSRNDLARVFADAYFQASGDDRGRELLPFYTAYRAMVRGKVRGFELREKEVPEPERMAACVNSRAHWLLALGQLEIPSRRPCLVLVGGHPGTGKSTLSRNLAERAHFAVVRSDQVRKELAGLGERSGKPVSCESGIYSPEWTERTYAECLNRAKTLLFAGGRVIVDARFSQEKWRRVFLETADSWGVPAIFFQCQAKPEVVRARLDRRSDDISDADWSVYLQSVSQWEEPGPITRTRIQEVSAHEEPEVRLSKCLETFSQRALLDARLGATVPEKK